MVEHLGPGERVNEDVDGRRAREHEPGDVVGEDLAREEHLEAATRVGTRRKWRQRAHLEMARSGESTLDEPHERARFLDPCAVAVVEIGVRVEALHFGAAATRP
jgi:hypothetical protein